MFDPKLVIDERLLLLNTNQDLASKSGAIKDDKQLIRYLSIKLSTAISSLYLSMEIATKPKKDEVAEYVIKRVAEVRGTMRFIINELVEKRSEGELSCFPDVSTSDDFNGLTSFVIDYVFNELYEIGFTDSECGIDELNPVVFANCFSVVNELISERDVKLDVLNNDGSFNVVFSHQVMCLFPRVMLWFNYFDFFILDRKKKIMLSTDIVKKIVDSVLTMKSNIELIGGVVDVSLIADSVAAIMRETFKSVSRDVVCEFNQLNESERSLWMMQVELEGGLPMPVLFGEFDENMKVHEEVTLGVFQSLMESDNDDDDHGDTGQPFVAGSVDDDYDYESDDAGGTTSH